MRCAAIAVLLLALTGCSFIVNRSSTSEQGAVTETCHGAAPVIDTVLATGAIVAGIAVAGAVRNDTHGDPAVAVGNAINFILVAGATGSVTGVFVASASHGFHKLDQCKPPSADELAAARRRDEAIQAAQLRRLADDAAARANQQRVIEIQGEERQLTDQARAAAAAGDCATVKAIDARVRAFPEVDPGIQGGFHDTVFLHYSDIVNCLAARTVDAGVPEGPPIDAGPSTVDANAP